MTLATGAARASCTYNYGPDPVSFTSGDYYSASPSSVYTSSSLGAGQDQCWYAHGWSNGYFQNQGAVGYGYLAGYPFDDINVQDHGWIDICLSGNPGWGADPSAAAAPWSYETYGVAGQPTGSGSNGQPTGCGAGTAADLAAPMIQARASRALTASSTAANRHAVFFTGVPVSRKTRSITFHIYNGRTRRPVGSVCLAPVDVSDVGLGFLSRLGSKRFYVGVTERQARCSDPRVASRERSGRPLPDYRYASSCDSVTARTLRLYRYPQDFRRRVPPSCRLARS